MACPQAWRMNPLGSAAVFYFRRAATEAMWPARDVTNVSRLVIEESDVNFPVLADWQGEARTAAVV